MRRHRRGWTALALAVPLVAAACASSKAGRPSGAVAQADQMRDTTSSAYGPPRGTGSRAARGSRITREDIDHAGNVSLATFLEARLAGVRVIGHRGEYIVRLTGTPSDGNLGALVLIDGSEGSIGGLELKDISTIEVLKDAAAAVYGVRGAYGVLMITTRRQ